MGKLSILILKMVLFSGSRCVILHHLEFLVVFLREPFLVLCFPILPLGGLYYISFNRTTPVGVWTNMSVSAFGGTNGLILVIFPGFCTEEMEWEKGTDRGSY